MQRSIEKERRTLEEATEVALKELGAKSDDVDIEVLDDGKSGFLGFGSRNARVRVTLKKGAAALGTEEPKTRPEETRKDEKEPRPDPERALREEEPAVDQNQVKELLSGMIQRMHMDGAIETLSRDGRVIANIIGEDSNLLIGKKGQTLDSIQFLLNLMYSKTMKKRANILVDVEEYKVRREKRLTSIALEVRDKVKRTRKPIAIAPMNAQDRRIIHLALQEDRAVKTVSRGEGLLRKVVVIPK